MDEPIYGVEFRFPEHMQKELDAITTSLAGFIIKTLAILYPDGDLPENAVEEMMGLVIPRMMESMEEAIDKLIEEWG